MDVEAFNEQQLDLAEFDRGAWGDTRRHRLIVDTEQEADKLAEYLEEHGFDEIFACPDDDSENFEVWFKSDHELSDAETDEIYNQSPGCTYQFNIEDY